MRAQAEGDAGIGKMRGSFASLRMTARNRQQQKQEQRQKQIPPLRCGMTARKTKA
jgi:hypothetical protein